MANSKAAANLRAHNRATEHYLTRVALLRGSPQERPRAREDERMQLIEGERESQLIREALHARELARHNSGLSQVGAQQRERELIDEAVHARQIARPCERMGL